VHCKTAGDIMNTWHIIQNIAMSVLSEHVQLISRGSHCGYAP